jgi:hypothetical protein
MLLIQNYLVILAVEECPQQFYFPLLRVMKIVLDVEIMFDASKRHKWGRGEKRVSSEIDRQKSL